MAILARATEDSVKYQAKKGEYYCGCINGAIFVFDSNPEFAKDVTMVERIPEGFEYVRYDNQSRVPSISS